MGQGVLKGVFEERLVEPFEGQMHTWAIKILFMTHIYGYYEL